MRSAPLHLISPVPITRLSSTYEVQTNDSSSDWVPRDAGYLFSDTPANQLALLSLILPFPAPNESDQPAASRNTSFTKQYIPD
ncbi:hypothetical protein I7I50_08252 [Histoplasma capsulatum G186AR]|uniref:Uncharacterized protein n=1 Tax=Ajellomyces capsulatus TaxID=5037 RepID=A0A8H8D0K2_AJECA|nr:hypothetical protein I7I52_05768 [Histoplasma capsulatum]QSS73469.1 hypothetical protein I7I50_08252 [Histoplasma capsulatum G186AR]